LQDVDFDTVVRHEFRAKFKRQDFGIKLSNGAVTARLGGNLLRGIEDREEIHNLVREKRLMSFSSFTAGDKMGCETYTFGDSWIFEQKDLTTGRIMKFTERKQRRRALGDFSRRGGISAMGYRQRDQAKTGNRSREYPTSE
jgi:hypothetical protein